MSEMFNSVSDLWDKIRSGHMELPTLAAIPHERCRPAPTSGYLIRREQMYFTIRINEMYLAENQQWWSVFDPLLVVVAEFNHGQERATVPIVIGPNLIRKQAPSDQPRHGVVLLDTRVTGPHPYRGGDVDVSLGFYRVQRANHADTLLKVIDSLSTSLGAPGEMQVIAKTGRALLEGVEGLLGLKETTYLAGLRISMATSPFDPFTAGFSALLTPPVPANTQRLFVQDRRLLVDDKGDSRIPYRDSDFVLLSVTGSETRGDENLLPFYSLKADALDALRDGEGGLKRAKANLIAAYQQMRRSPDMTPSEAGVLFDAWLEEFQLEKKRLEQVRAMPVEYRKFKADLLTVDLNEATRRVQL
jgi:hypothetical protein